MKIQTIASSSKGNAYLISDGITTLLLECGVSVKKIQQAINYKLSSVAGCLVTHEHKDHCKGVKDLTKYGVKVYMTKGTSEAVAVTSNLINIINAKTSFKIGTWSVLPFDVQHDAKEPVGFLLASSLGYKVLFATDTYYIKYQFAGLTHLMVECNYDINILNVNIALGVESFSMKNRLLTSHLSLENLKKMLMANDLQKVQEIHLLHLSDKNSDAEMFKQEIAMLTGKPVYIAG